ncbi:PleD family two-component system response regulator [Thermodesulfobacteriota bacterium]
MSKKILIADDLPEIRKLVRLTLQSDDYQVLEARNGKEAVDIARDMKPDLIIMDIIMPGEIDGLEATKILKEDPITKGCPIIMLTSKGEVADREKGLDVGVIEYFAKPFSPLELIQKVEQVLGI